MSTKDVTLENRLTRLEEADKNIMRMIESLASTCVTKVEHANALSKMDDLQEDLDDYKVDNNKRLDKIAEILNGFSLKMAMYVGGTIVVSVGAGFIIWLGKEVLSKWIQGW